MLTTAPANPCAAALIAAAALRAIKAATCDLRAAEASLQAFRYRMADRMEAGGKWGSMEINAYCRDGNNLQAQLAEKLGAVTAARTHLASLTAAAHFFE